MSRSEQSAGEGWEAAEKTQHEDAEASQQMLKKGMAKLEKVRHATLPVAEKFLGRLGFILRSKCVGHDSEAVRSFGVHR